MRTISVHVVRSSCSPPSAAKATATSDPPRASVSQASRPSRASGAALTRGRGLSVRAAASDDMSAHRGDGCRGGAEAEQDEDDDQRGGKGLARGSRSKCGQEALAIDGDRRRMAPRPAPSARPRRGGGGGGAAAPAPPRRPPRGGGAP